MLGSGLRYPQDDVRLHHFQRQHGTPDQGVRPCRREATETRVLCGLTARPCGCPTGTDRQGVRLPAGPTAPGVPTRTMTRCCRPFRDAPSGLWSDGNDDLDCWTGPPTVKAFYALQRAPKPHLPPPNVTTTGATLNLNLTGTRTRRGGTRATKAARPAPRSRLALPLPPSACPQARRTSTRRTARPAARAANELASSAMFTTP